MNFYAAVSYVSAQSQFSACCAKVERNHSEQFVLLSRELDGR